MFINAAARTGSLLLAAGSSEACARAVRPVGPVSPPLHIPRGAHGNRPAAAASPELHDLALEVAGIIAGEITAGHDSADERIRDLIGLSRAICRLSRDESREYFQQAMEAAELVGDDVRARWDALLKISGAASRSEAPDRARAYRLAQVAESLAPYLDDALDHEAAIHAIGQLDPREGNAVASRWRDRRLGWLDPVIEALAVRDDCTLAPAAGLHRDDAAPAAPGRPAGGRAGGAQLPGRCAGHRGRGRCAARSAVSSRSGLEVLRAAAAQSGAAFDGTRLERNEAPRHPGYEEDTGARTGTALTNQGQRHGSGAETTRRARPCYR